jgi:hypothetical protein
MNVRFGASLVLIKAQRVELHTFGADRPLVIALCFASATELTCRSRTLTRKVRLVRRQIWYGRYFPLSGVAVDLVL